MFAHSFSFLISFKIWRNSVLILQFLFILLHIIKVSCFCYKEHFSLISFFSKKNSIKFYYILQLFYSVICQLVSKFIKHFGYCEQCYCEHRYKFSFKLAFLTFLFGGFIWYFHFLSNFCFYFLWDLHRFTFSSIESSPICLYHIFNWVVGVRDHTW